MSEKSDVFSIAATFFTLFKQLQEPAWITGFGEARLAYQNIARYGNRYKDILSKENPTQIDLGIEEPKDTLELVLYKMLHPNPEKRISLGDAIKELKKAIKARWPDSDQKQAR